MSKSKPSHGRKRLAPTQQPPRANPDREFGEGNYHATREYNRATRRFVESGKVAAAAKAAKPTSDSEAQELQQAESAGHAKRKEEDPALLRDYRKQNRT